MKSIMQPIVIIDPQQLSVPCFFMRGGSSRGGVFLNTELPDDPIERAALLLGIYGSPDVRQIDGIGGADPLTSKAAVVAKSSRADADLDYTFYQVDVARAKVSTGGNCGNMLAAVAPFGIWRGLVSAQEGENIFRIYTTNTDQVVMVRIHVKDGAPCVTGTTAIPGVPGTGSAVSIDFGDCAGSVSGKLLPSGQPLDVIDIGGSPVRVSLVDAATPFVFVHAEDLGGVTGAESAEEMQANATLMGQLEVARGWAAKVLGMVDDIAAARQVTPNVPRVIMVSAAQQYQAGGQTVLAEDTDICVRQLAMQKPHKALAVTGSVCTAVAAQVPGTTVQLLLRPGVSHSLRLGHPSGVLSVTSDVSVTGQDLKIHRASVERTARLIMAGHVFVPYQNIEKLKKLVEL